MLLFFDGLAVGILLMYLWTSVVGRLIERRAARRFAYVLTNKAAEVPRPTCDEKFDPYDLLPEQFQKPETN